MRMLLGISSLMVMWFFCATSSAQPKETALPKGVMPKSVTGRGETLDTAKNDAVRQVVEKVTVLMRLNEPELKSFMITEDYVRQHLVVDGRQGKDFQVDAIADPFKSWIFTIRTDTDWWQDIVRHDREAERKVREAERKVRAEARQWLGVRIVFGLAALLLAGVSYVLLDEHTHRRYTAWLRVAGVGVATSALAGWWWIVGGG